MITSLDTGAAPNLPLTGWEGLMGGAGGGDSLQQCAILAHSLMSQQFGQSYLTQFYVFLLWVRVCYPLPKDLIYFSVSLFSRDDMRLECGQREEGLLQTARLTLSCERRIFPE